MRARNASLIIIRLTRASAWMWSLFLSGGLASRTMSRTGWPSMASKSMGVAGRPMAMHTAGIPGHLPWGMARPCPMPVVRVHSRVQTASLSAWASFTLPKPASRSTSSLITPCLSVATRGARMC